MSISGLGTRVVEGDNEMAPCKGAYPKGGEKMASERTIFLGGRKVIRHRIEART